MIEKECPGCGWVHEMLDTMDAYPPIPTSAWPERWSIHDGEGRGMMACPVCDEPVENFGLPDYPWKTPDEGFKKVIDANVTDAGGTFTPDAETLGKLEEIAYRPGVRFRGQADV